MKTIPPVNSLILVTFPDKRYDKQYVMKIVDDNVKNDSFGTIKLQILEDKETKTRQEHKWEFYKEVRYPKMAKYVKNPEMRTRIKYFRTYPF